MAEPRIISSEFRYRILRRLHEGGMGIVYEAEQEGARGFVKRVAIKVIRDRFAQQPEFIENFIGEARLVADLIHTNIVQTYHLGETAGACYISMELIRGVNLEQFLDRLRTRRRRLPLELAVFIISRVARGLAYAHAKTDTTGAPLGIVHRDVSPKNVMMAFEGDVKLTDFGIAKARGFLTSREGEEVAGKPEYMSPEQADFQITDRRSDLFSAGVVLAELLVGRNIFKGATPEDSQRNVIRAELPDFPALNPEIEPRLDALLRRVLARDPAERFQSADELLYELEFLIYHRGYGPTNETLGRFLRELFPREAAPTGGAGPGGTLRVAASPGGTGGSTARGPRNTGATRASTRRTAADRGPGGTLRTPAPARKRPAAMLDRLKARFRPSAPDA